MNENELKTFLLLLLLFLLVTFENDQNLFWVYHFENFQQKIIKRGANFTSCQDKDFFF